MPAPAAILVPTKIELELLEPHLKQFRAIGTPIELCGWGPVVAAARTSQIIGQLPETQIRSKGSPDSAPAFLLLIGIAGVLPASKLSSGNAYLFDSCVLDGVGVGIGEKHQSAKELGWQLWPELGDILQTSDNAPNGLQLLTVCSASADPSEAEARQTKFPAADAEDMETYAVATSAYMHQHQLKVIRGISNQAGFRDHRRWKIEESLEAAAKLAIEMYLP